MAALLVEEPFLFNSEVNDSNSSGTYDFNFGITYICECELAINLYECNLYIDEGFSPLENVESPIRGNP